MEIKQLGKHDTLLFQKLIELFREVFEDNQPWIGQQEQYTPLLRSDFIVYVILDGGQVLGGLTAYELADYYSGIPEIFIYDIAIKSEHQRKGLGEMLLEKILKYGRSIGAREIFVMAHAEDQHALDFYKKTGGESETVISFTYKPTK
ncbi:GNAT family N-acetyltransferase [Fulvivirga sp. 29W222]|uniref:GNAT family N-acetyltransferase n=1 Tax=Fulvivirga marina TaxID=2494733 RepID=A0A937FWX7_9BACT|nr:GNAT family N-acetyltransferase [Fulvivirga marina]MBL6445896.1 GNAT family N-acetyltransferase [Fulvivirga marina]